MVNGDSEASLLMTVTSPSDSPAAGAVKDSANVVDSPGATVAGGEPTTAKPGPDTVIGPSCKTSPPLLRTVTRRTMATAPARTTPKSVPSSVDAAAAAAIGWP